MRVLPVAALILVSCYTSRELGGVAPTRDAGADVGLPDIGPPPVDADLPPLDGDPPPPPFDSEPPPPTDAVVPPPIDAVVPPPTDAVVPPPFDSTPPPVDVGPFDAFPPFDAGPIDAAPFDAPPIFDGPSPDAIVTPIDAGFGPCQRCGELSWGPVQQITLRRFLASTRRDPAIRMGPAAFLDHYVVIPVIVFPDFITNQIDLGYVVVNMIDQTVTHAVVTRSFPRGSSRVPEGLRPHAVAVGSRVLVVAPGVWAWVDPANPAFAVNQGGLSNLGDVADVVVAANLDGRAVLVQVVGEGRITGARQMVTAIADVDGPFTVVDSRQIHTAVSLVAPLWAGRHYGTTGMHMVWLAERLGGLRTMYWLPVSRGGDILAAPQPVDIAARFVPEWRPAQTFLRGETTQVFIPTAGRIRARLMTIGPGEPTFSTSSITTEADWLGDGFAELRQNTAVSWSDEATRVGSTGLFDDYVTESSLVRRVPCHGALAATASRPVSAELVDFPTLQVSFGSCSAE